jgi:hypothetical protein
VFLEPTANRPAVAALEPQQSDHNIAIPLAVSTLLLSDWTVKVIPLLGADFNFRKANNFIAIFNNCKIVIFNRTNYFISSFGNIFI